jgi:hypothetical protein
LGFLSLLAKLAMGLAKYAQLIDIKIVAGARFELATFGL